jgi:hypothetical protein
MVLKDEQVKILKDLGVEILNFEYGIWSDKITVCYICTYLINGEINSVKSLTKNQLIELLIQKELQKVKC